MIKFLENIGDFFATNYFDEDFVKNVHAKSGYNSKDQKGLQKRISPLKDKYFKYKQSIIEGRLRTKDKIYETHQFHTQLLNALGYDGEHHQYNEPFHFSETEVLPVRHKLYRGDKLHLLILEMQPLIKEGDEEPDGLFEQRYNIEEDELQTKEQRYHRSQWSRVFNIDESLKVSPAVINKAISQICLLEQKERPQFILLLAGNVVFLIDVEKWFRGSYLYFDLEEFFSEATITRNYYSLFYLLLSKEMLAPDSEMVLMEQLEEDSHKSAYEVTKDLKEGIIHAVEALANEAIYYKKKILKEEFDETDDHFEAQVKDDCLSIIYRLLFIFYAESRADLDILPISHSVYQKGYSLEMLRDLELTPLVTEHAANGYFFHESLNQLFQLMSCGYRESENQMVEFEDGEQVSDFKNRSFRIRHIDSPLFDDEKLNQLKGVKYRNKVWQDVICQLSLSKEVRGKNRGRISYANLGINQLGSVYESLLAFRGFYAEQDYIEVHPNNKPNEGTLLVPRKRRDDFKDGEVLKDEHRKEVIIPKGQFVYRLSGRDRQKSASYYTPEVLTECTVKYTLKSILELVESGEMKALELLELKLLEPAMGAAAFHNELINQLAEAYLSFRQRELGKKVSPEKYREELQKVKAYIATNNTYGVDLNPTAIELGKLSLWLNVIHKDMETPFFGYRLGVGNAVVGAWLKAYKKKDIIVEFPSQGTTAQRNKPIKKEWWEKAPKRLHFKLNGPIQRQEDEIYHFLLPDQNMVPSAGIKLLKDEFLDQAKRVSEWRKDFCTPLGGEEFKRLQKISKAIDALLEEHYKFQASINAQTKLKGNFFGAYKDDEQGQLGLRSYDEKEKLASKRNNTNAPYYKLKLIMDYWCSLWFWDMREASELPTRQQWYDDLEKIINIDLKQIEVVYEEVEGNPVSTPTLRQTSLFEGPSKQYTLKAYRKDKSVTLKKLGEALQSNPDSLFKNKRSEIVNRLADQYKFFHNELEFIEVFKERGGFDVAVGNPPWVKVEFEEKGIIAESNPEVYIRKFSAHQAKNLCERVLKSNDSLDTLYKTEIVGYYGIASFLNSFQNYPFQDGQAQASNLYRNILENCINSVSNSGFIGLIHPEGIYEDPKGQVFRKEIYPRLVYHFQFKNELSLFSEVHHETLYSTNVYKGEKSVISFDSINNLFHPSTIDGCYSHNGHGISEGFKVKDFATNKMVWNTRPHRSRIIHYTEDKLKILAKTFENSEKGKETKLVSIHSENIIAILTKFGNFPKRVCDYSYYLTDGWRETDALNSGHIKRETKIPSGKQDIIIGGPHFFVANPFYKNPYRECRLNSDYDTIDQSEIEINFIPRTIFQPLIGREKFTSRFVWEEYKKNWINSYKLVFRKMVGLASERTLASAILSPNVSHTSAGISLMFEEDSSIVELAGLCSSIPLDFYIKSLGRSNLYESTLKNLLLGVTKEFSSKIKFRALILNCLTESYQELWTLNWSEDYKREAWSVKDNRLSSFKNVKKKWDINTPLRNSFERRMALIELDVLVTMALNINLEDLISMYKVQFSVLQQYEDDTWYDTQGNIVFTCSKGLTGVGVDRPVWNEIKELKEGETYEHTIEKSELYYGKKVTYYAPFDKCDRVEDYRVAWAYFEEVFKEEK